MGIVIAPGEIIAKKGQQREEKNGRGGKMLVKNDKMVMINDKRLTEGDKMQEEVS